MAVSLSTIAAKDGAGASIAGGLQAIDLSGVGTGPWSMAHVLVDGAAGVNRMGVDSSGRLTVNQGGTWNVTNISGTVSLPTGAATAAKQPALGTAGAASADVITIQGVASMTPVRVDPTGTTTQPVSIVNNATVTAGSATSITTGGTAVAVFSGVTNGGIILNPSTATESLYVDMVNTPTVGISGTTIELFPGDRFQVPAGVTNTVRAIAATTSHAFMAVKW